MHCLLERVPGLAHETTSFNREQLSRNKLTLDLPVVGHNNHWDNKLDHQQKSQTFFAGYEPIIFVPVVQNGVGPIKLSSKLSNHLFSDDCDDCDCFLMILQHFLIGSS